MISKSDLLILVVASSALAVGIYRWHTNTQDVSAITIPASSRVAVVEPVNGEQQPNDNLLSQTRDAASLNAQPTDNANANPVIVQTVAETTPVRGIVVESTTDNNAQTVGVHQVQSGDYLGKIAQQYDTDVQTLRDLNGISGTVIHIGDDILYPL